MRLRSFLLVPVVLISLTGCGHRSVAIPDNSFRLTLTDLLASEDERVSVIAIETREHQTYSVRTQQSFFLTGGSSKAVMPPAAADPYRPQAITLVAYRHGEQDGQRDWRKTVIKTEYGTVTDARWLPHGGSLSNMLVLSAHDGIYPTSKPLVLSY